MMKLKRTGMPEAAPFSTIIPDIPNEEFRLDMSFMYVPVIVNVAAQLSSSPRCRWNSCLFMLAIPKVISGASALL